MSGLKKKFVHILFYKDQSAVCPICGGLAATCKSDEIILHCVDCGTFFRTIGFGQAESEILCEEVLVGKNI